MTHCSLCMAIRMSRSHTQIPALCLKRFFLLTSLDPAAKLNHYGCEDPREREVAGGTRPTPAFGSVAEGSPLMPSILHEISTIRQFLEKRDEFRDVAREWLQVGYVLDVLLFRAYLLAVLAYTITLGALWSVWQYA